MSKKLIRFDQAIKRLLRGQCKLCCFGVFLSEVLFDDNLARVRKIVEAKVNGVSIGLA